MSGRPRSWTAWKQKALASGASQLIIHDLREEFASEYIFPVLKAGAIYERKYLLGTRMARPLIAKHLVDVAHLVGADAVAHGATGKGNDQVRFELTSMALDPRLKIIAPWREWEHPLARRRHRLCASAQRAHHRHPQIDLQPRPQPVAHFARRRAARRPLAGAGRRHVLAERLAFDSAPTSPILSRSSSRAATRWRSMARSSPRPPWSPSLNAVGRAARHRARRPGGRPPGGDEIARRLRDPRRHDPAGGAPRARIARPRQAKHWPSKT